MKQWGICMTGNEIKIASAILNVSNNYAYDELFIYVEIGVARGDTFIAVCELLDLTLLNWRAVAIDIRQGWSLDFKGLTNRTSKYRNQVLLSFDGSPDAFKDFPFNKIDVAFIDGNHGSEEAMQDFRAVDKLLVSGGIAIFHDTDVMCQGMDVHEFQPKGIQVRKACEELGFLDNTNPNYELITDFVGVSRYGGRGIVIVKKK